MASSSSQYPYIQFGDFSPEFLPILMNAANTQTQPPPPLSPQLRFSQTKKPPRTPPRTVWQPLLPPHPTLSRPAVNRSYVIVPSNWCLANRVGNRGTYLSRNLLLVKMYERRNLFRIFHGKEELLDARGIVRIIGSPVEYFLTFPLKPLECKQPPPLLEGISLRKNVEVAHVWANGPLKCSRNTLNRHCTGLQPLGGRPFNWVINSTGTKMLTIKEMLSRGIEMVTGVVECRKCGNVWGIGYRLARCVEAAFYVMEKKDEIMVEGNQVLQSSPFNCECDGKKNPVRPFISDDFSKINWMCLLSGYGLGFCTIDQLQYFCRERKLETLGETDKNLILLRVCKDLLQQAGVGPYMPLCFKSVLNM